MERFDVAALGELLIDFVQTGCSEQGEPVFKAAPGGAPANVLAMLGRLGRRCAFLGKVGRDAFGDRLEQTLRELGIDAEGLRRDPVVPTTLAIVHTLSDGDRDFSFYRKPGADICLRPEELKEDVLTDCRIFHFGSLSLTDEPARSATARALELARSGGALISYDPNLRMSLWESEAAAKEQIEWGLARCDVLKISDNEVTFLTGEDDLIAGTAVLRERFPQIRLLNVTAGAEGSRSTCGPLQAFEPACPLGGVTDTTGAGDTFCALVLHYLLDHPIGLLDEAQLHEMLRTANAAAYLVTTKKGAIPAMPDRGQIEALLARWDA